MDIAAVCFLTHQVDEGRKATSSLHFATGRGKKEGVKSSN